MGTGEELRSGQVGLAQEVDRWGGAGGMAINSRKNKINFIWLCMLPIDI